MAASSFQLTLLTDQTTQKALQLYILASIYLVASIAWWIVFRRFQALYCLSFPFYIYALAFFLLGLPAFSPFSSGRRWVNNVATGCYALASSSGSLFFGLNFAEDGIFSVLIKVDCRWRSCYIVDLPCLYYPGISTDLCRWLVVLGTQTGYPECGRPP